MNEIDTEWQIKQDAAEILWSSCSRTSTEEYIYKGVISRHSVNCSAQWMGAESPYLEPPPACRGPHRQPCAARPVCCTSPAARSLLPTPLRTYSGHAVRRSARSLHMQSVTTSAKHPVQAPRRHCIGSVGAGPRGELHSRALHISEGEQAPSVMRL